MDRDGVRGDLVVEGEGMEEGEAGRRVDFEGRSALVAAVGEKQSQRKTSCFNFSLYLPSLPNLY